MLRIPWVADNPLLRPAKLAAKSKIGGDRIRAARPPQFYQAAMTSSRIRLARGAESRNCPKCGRRRGSGAESGGGSRKPTPPPEDPPLSGLGLGPLSTESAIRGIRNSRNPPLTNFPDGPPVSRRRRRCQAATDRSAAQKVRVPGLQSRADKGALVPFDWIGVPGYTPARSCSPFGINFYIRIPIVFSGYRAAPAYGV